MRVAHLGDPLAGRGIPVIDFIHGGSAVELPETLAHGSAGITDVDSIISRHSDEMAWDELRRYAAFDREFVAWGKGAMDERHERRGRCRAARGATTIRWVRRT